MANLMARDFRTCLRQTFGRNDLLIKGSRGSQGHDSEGPAVHNVLARVTVTTKATMLEAQAQQTAQSLEHTAAR